MQLYFESERHLKLSKNSKTVGSLSGQIFGDKKLKNSPKHVYALVYSTLKYKDYIKHIVKKSKIRESPQIKKLKISDELLALLVNDFLFSSKGRIQSGKHRIKDAFLLHKVRLRAEMTKMKLHYKVRNIDELPTVETEDSSPVRWFRINSLKVSAETFFANNPEFNKLKKIETFTQLTEPGLIYKDTHIENLYGVHPREKITSTKAYEHGQIIIQDRASCFPAEILTSDPNDTHIQVIDACAAPGNKTTHVAARIASHDSSVVYAFEKDSRRVEVLKEMTKKASAKTNAQNFQIMHADFTSINPKDFPGVTGLVVDPSCSGSGTFGRQIQDSHKENDVSGDSIDTNRLEKLASFQVKIMKHALSFPNARKVVYSTCSVYPQENEQVVVDLLLDQQVRSQGWTLEKRDFVLPSWERRGWKEEFTALSEGNEEIASKYADGCVRSLPKEDGGIGFFASCFVKREIN